MKTKLFIAVGLLAILALTIAATVSTDISGTTIRYRSGSTLKFDPQSGIADEDGGWTLSNAKLKNVAGLQFTSTNLTRPIGTNYPGTAGHLLTTDGTNAYWAAAAAASSVAANTVRSSNIVDGAIGTNDVDAVFYEHLLSPAYDAVTNGWSADTALPLATNLVFTSGAATLGFTGVSSLPTSTERWGRMTIVATGDIVFTNPANVYASDYVLSRTVTNGNTAQVTVHVIPGVATNLNIDQFDLGAE